MLESTRSTRHSRCSRSSGAACSRKQRGDALAQRAAVRLADRHARARLVDQAAAQARARARRSRSSAQIRRRDGRSARQCRRSPAGRGTRRSSRAKFCAAVSSTAWRRVTRSVATPSARAALRAARSSVAHRRGEARPARHAGARGRCAAAGAVAIARDQHVDERTRAQQSSAAQRPRRPGPRRVRAPVRCGRGARSWSGGPSCAAPDVAAGRDRGQRAQTRSPRAGAAKRIRRSEARGDASLGEQARPQRCGP